MIGLGVMGENLVLNIESKGFSVAVFNRTTEVTDKFAAGRAKGKNIQPTQTLEEFVEALKKPRIAMLMVKAGPPVDSVISQLARASWLITESTGGPAFTINIAIRGFLSASTNSSSVCVGWMFFPLARPAANLSVTSVVRLNTATEKPLDSMFRTRFSPMTPRPIMPISH